MEVDRIEDITAASSQEAPPPSAIEQMMPLIAMVMTITVLGAVMSSLGEGGQ